MYVFLVDAQIFQSGIRSIKPDRKDGFPHDMPHHHNASHILVIAKAGVADDLPSFHRGSGGNVKTI
jgi:hypothetical protein